MTTKLRFALIILVVFAIAFAITRLVVYLTDDGAGKGTASATAGQLNWAIEDAKTFTEFPLYWLSDSYQGLLLTRIIRNQYEPVPPAVRGENIVLFVYGSCTPTSEGGCPVPLSIRVEPYCMARPDSYSTAARGTPFNLRGATAEQISGHLQIWTGDVSISISTAGSLSQVQAAEQLRLVDEGPEGALQTLGPPNISC